MQDLSFDRSAAFDGIRRVAPIAVPGVPVGFVLGFLVKDLGLPTVAGWSTGWLIFAGSAQLAALNLLADGASAAVILTTVFLINSRHAMYSAALRERFAELPLWFRIVGSYFLLDQQFAVADTAPELRDPTPRYRIWHFLGAGVFLWLVWQVSMAAGVFAGDVVREEWALNFAVPLLFLGLLVMSIRDRPGLLAAVVSGVVVIAGRNLPQGSGLLLAIVLGIAAATYAENRMERVTS
ncbi:MAG: putative branched-subunit amino acid permease [Verrucomicrobiales bacterium]|jgi:predicted branched-subunit amino acid permease